MEDGSKPDAPARESTRVSLAFHRGHLGAIRGLARIFAGMQQVAGAAALTPSAIPALVLREAAGLHRAEWVCAPESQTMWNHRDWARLAALSLLLLSTACGDDDDDTTSPSPAGQGG